jgi:hypothetical protein
MRWTDTHNAQREGPLSPSQKKGVMGRRGRRGARGGPRTGFLAGVLSCAHSQLGARCFGRSRAADWAIRQLDSTNALLQWRQSGLRVTRACPTRTKVVALT